MNNIVSNKQKIEIMLERKNVDRVIDKYFEKIARGATFVGLIVLAILILDVLVDGLARVSIQFLTSYPSRFAERAGILSAMVGTIWLMILTLFIAVPLGVAAAVYLEEYGKQNRLTQIIEINIANLAGVPSIIYGLLGLGMFVRGLHLGRSVLAGALTLAVLVLPIVVMATREALRSVPSSIREASYALGASKWDTIRHQVIPACLPGILTGSILAMSRAIGETAPLITLGALTYVAFIPTPPLGLSFPFISFQGLLDPFTALPIQIYNWVSRPQPGFWTAAAAGIVVLLFITFAINGAAVYLRNKYQKNIRW
jgi:phosphate transport system permease protein